jgi:hypothetical protein
MIKAKGILLSQGPGAEWQTEPKVIKLLMDVLYEC